MTTVIWVQTRTSDPERAEWLDNNPVVVGRCHRLGECLDLRRQEKIWGRQRVRSLVLDLLLASSRFGGQVGWCGIGGCRLRLFEA
jgi:hypothetical protein